VASGAFFGTSLAALGDVNGDGKLDLAVGAEGDDTGGTDRGALWILFLESEALPPLVVRNGRGLNPVILSAVEAPAVGTTWEVRVDCRAFNQGLVFHQVTDRPIEGCVYGRLGELLIDLRRPWLLRVVARHLGAETSLFHAVPAVPALVGLPFYSQAFVTGGGRPRFTNALDGEFTQARKTSQRSGG
jgi:hypothetical protein